MQYVQTTPDRTAIAVWYAGPQSITTDKPFYAVIADDDPRYIAWLAAQQVSKEYTIAIGAGVQIVSTGTPALNGTYAIDTPAQQNLSAVAAGIASRNRVPGGGTTFNYYDTAGNPHAFNATNFLNFASAVEDYVYALDEGQFPSQPVTIP
jgi:hypothetical protein